MDIVTGDLSRRSALLRIGALSLGGGMASVSGSSEAAQVKSRRQRSCIFILLQGGPSHHDYPTPRAERESPFCS